MNSTLEPTIVNYDASPHASTMAQALKEAMESLGGVQQKTTIEKWIEEKYPKKWMIGTLVGHLYGCSVNNPNGIKHHRSFPRFLFDRGSGKYELYDRAKHGSYDPNGYIEGQNPDYEQTEENDRDLNEEFSEKARNEFRYEAHLRDYLANNLSILENGLSLWTGEEQESVEYNLDGRRIDILAKDKAGIPVVIELKVSRGHERTIGQALFYRGKLKLRLGVSTVRIIIVASEITEELQIACQEVQDLELFSYVLSMQVQRAQIPILERGNVSTRR
jgi:hypothetical protein